LKKRFNINVMGQDISVSSDRGDDHVENVVRYINEKAGEIEKNSRDVTTLGIAIMVTLNLTEELFRVNEEQERLRSQIESKAEKLINHINKTRANINDPLRCS
jgi:cell division protein ZapA (FtsZ GTPase activity inhibitor)